MSKNNAITLAVVEALRSDPDARHLSHNVLFNMAERFIGDVKSWGMESHFLDATAKMPGDEPPAEKKYPRREELQPEFEPVPSPDETETATATKISIPNQPEQVKRFAVAMANVSNATQKLFEMLSEENTEAERQREVAFSFLAETEAAVRDM
jgi:hypothetical protein